MKAILLIKATLPSVFDKLGLGDGNVLNISVALSLALCVHSHTSSFKLKFLLSLVNDIIFKDSNNRGSCSSEEAQDIITKRLSKHQTHFIIIQNS